MTIQDTLFTLVSTYGATGREETVASVIEAMVRPLVDDIRTDALGNLICTRKGSGPRVMLAAHMDHIGLIVTDADENGFLRIGAVGGIVNNHILHTQVVFGNGVRGVVSYETDRDYPGGAVPITRMFIDIGAKNREDALAQVPQGEVGVFAPSVIVQNGRMSAPSMDNRAGCAVVIEALRALKGKTIPYEVVAVFTTQEEVGLRGAMTAAFSVAPDFAIATDVCTVGDTPKARHQAIALGKGPTIKIMDASVLTHNGLRKQMVRIAKERDIPFQMEVLLAGGTDTAAIQKSRGGVAAGCISIPTRYIHSMSETVDMEDMRNAAKLMAAILETPFEL